MVLAERVKFRMQSISCWLYCNTKPPYSKHAGKEGRGKHESPLLTGMRVLLENTTNTEGKGALHLQVLPVCRVCSYGHCWLLVSGGSFSLWVHFVSFLCCDTSQEKLAQALH